MAEPLPDRESANPYEAAAVRAGWQLVDAYERLTTRAAGQVFGNELRAWREYALDTVADLKPWAPGLHVYETDTCRLRFRRVLDFVLPGERVFDVGFGRGYLAGLLLRDRDVAAYSGIDIIPTFAPHLEQMVEVNGFDPERVRVAVGDVYELDRAEIEQHRPDVVVCCEVLEHVPDPERALECLANALPDGTELLFSVPLHGRLEAVWGHLTVFDAARLRQMIERAGLYVHHIEPVGNIWTIVIASRSPEPSARVAGATGRPRVNVATPLTTAREFVVADADQIVPAGRSTGATVAVEPGLDGAARCTLVATDDGGEICAGVRIPVTGLVSWRLKLGLIDAADVESVHVDLYDGPTHVGSWARLVEWAPPGEKPVNAQFQVRPGEGGFFRQLKVPKAAQADRLLVRFGLKPGGSATLDLRAAYLPA